MKRWLWIFPLFVFAAYQPLVSEHPVVCDFTEDLNSDWDCQQDSTHCPMCLGTSQGAPCKEQVTFSRALIYRVKSPGHFAFSQNSDTECYRTQPCKIVNSPQNLCESYGNISYCSPENGTLDSNCPRCVVDDEKPVVIITAPSRRAIECPHS